MSTFPALCSRRQEVVTDDSCLDCFTDDEHIAVRVDANHRRMACVETHIHAHALGLLAIDSSPVTAQDLNQLPETALRHIIGNALMVAQADPDSPTGRTVMAEVRLHVNIRRRELARWEREQELRNAEVEQRREEVASAF